MSFEHPLRGACACRRNQYFIQAPRGVDEVAQVLFGTGSTHRIAQAAPISAHIRVPLEWYHSATFSFFPDETAAMIRRVYENPFEGHARRHFCGFCGTPLTYWSEGGPRGSEEANYIQVTMGSLCREDLGDLEDMGLIPEAAIPSSPSSASSPPPTSSRGPHNRDSPAEGVGTMTVGENGNGYRQRRQQQQQQQLAPPIRGGGRETTGIPWFDTILEGSRLAGRLRTTKGLRQSADGATRVEWEIVEYADDAHEPGTPSGNSGKRKMDDRDDADDTQMEGVSQ